MIISRATNCFLLVVAWLTWSASLSCCSSLPAQNVNDAATFARDLNQLLAQHELERANATLALYLSQTSPSPEELLEIGRIYFEHEYWQNAVELLRKSIALQPQSDLAHLLLGLSLAEIGQADESERELSIAVRQNPKSEMNCYFAGWRLLVRSKYEDALPYFYKALTLNPRNPNTYRALGSALSRTGSYGLAETYYRKAIGLLESQPTPEPYLDLAYLLLLGNRKESAAEALDCAMKAQRINPNMAEAHYLGGKALMKLDRYVEAERELRKATHLNSNDARPYFLLAQAYDRMGKPAQANDARKAFGRISQRRVDESQGMELPPSR